jgi:hypothetical protein
MPSRRAEDRIPPETGHPAVAFGTLMPIGLPPTGPVPHPRRARHDHA